ncbi:MAG: hypothetical protein PHV06_03545 [bacterium]|nr:hypothetical protein [bacterium]
MKFCIKCGNVFESNLVVCSNCAVELSEVTEEWLLEINPEQFKNLSTDSIKELIKSNRINVHCKIKQVMESDWNEVYKIPIFQTCFSREEHWIVRTEGKEFDSLSKEQIIVALRDKKLSGEEECFHPSVNEWRLIKEFMEFSYLFIDELKTCPYCHARNSKSSVICWKCFKSFPGKEKAKSPDSSIVERPKKVVDSEILGKDSPKLKSYKSLYIILFILLLLLIPVYYWYNNNKESIKKKKQLEISKGVEIINCSGSWELQEYDDYSVKNFIIKGSIRNASQTAKKIVILKGIIFDFKSEIISEKNFSVVKNAEGIISDTDISSIIESGDEINFLLKFYPNEINGREISSWDVNIFYVSE